MRVMEQFIVDRATGAAMKLLGGKPYRDGVSVTFDPKKKKIMGWFRKSW